jgi:hypothetical protein
MHRPKIVCLTPVKNEAWILERFLKCASLWADHIIIADQASDDGSREIARSFKKVQLIENSAAVFNEPERQKLLIEAARAIPGDKLLIALDADEFLTANFLGSREWDLILRAVPGTVINFQWACVLPDRQSYYVFPTEFSLGFLDDGAEHQGMVIHSPRLPVPEDSPRISLREVKVMHFSTIDFDRFKSKIRWYQCWEFSKHRWDGRLVQLYRWYHRDFHVPRHQVRPLPNEWTTGYGPSMHLLDVPKHDYYRWDEDLLRLFVEQGTNRFSKIALWDQDWEIMYKRINGSSAPLKLSDPRSRIEKWVHAWLERTQPFYSHYAPPLSRVGRLYHRCFEKLFGYLGW